MHLLCRRALLPALSRSLRVLLNRLYDRLDSCGWLQGEVVGLGAWGSFCSMAGVMPRGERRPRYGPVGMEEVDESCAQKYELNQ